MATMYSTTRPLMQIQVGHQSSLTHGKAHLGLSHPHGVLQVAGCTSTLTTATGVVVVWLPCSWSVDAGCSRAAPYLTVCQWSVRLLHLAARGGMHQPGSSPGHIDGNGVFYH